MLELAAVDAMHDDDIHLFRQEVADVTPIPESTRVTLKSPRIFDPGQRYRREAAQRPVGGDDNPLPTTFTEYVGPNSVLSFRRDGIQHGVFKRLVRGEYPIDVILDLHQYTAEQARHAVHGFIGDCKRHDVRLALINHGKGGREPGKPPVIKSLLARWLPMIHEVLAFHSAQNFHGGTGALYVLFRKTEKLKNRTREKLGLVELKKTPDF